MGEMIFSDIGYYGGCTAIGVLAVAGTLCNGLSLSFFLKHHKDCLADKHLIALNIIDLLICCLSPATHFCLGKYAKQKIELLDHVILESFLSMSLLSCFVTTILSVVRTIVLMQPLYIIRTKYIYLTHGINMIFILGLITSKLISCTEQQDQSNQFHANSGENISDTISFILFAINYFYVLITVSIVGISCAIVVRALGRPPEILILQAARPNNETNRKATVMILILSVVFVILNGTWCVFWATCTFIDKSLNSDSPEDQDLVDKMKTLAMFVSLFLVTINSCANPLVYLLRNSRLNNHTTSLVRRLKQFLTRKDTNCN